jgi:hypothetical protein
LADEDTDDRRIMVSAVVTLFFIWRFMRTHNLYRYSFKVIRGKMEPIRTNPSVSGDFFKMVLLRNRNVEPTSFYVRALVFASIALALLPFRDYTPTLYWTATFLIILYIPWCVGHGLLLKKEEKKTVMAREIVGTDYLQYCQEKQMQIKNELEQSQYIFL